MFGSNGRRRPGRLTRALITRAVGTAAVLAAVTVAAGCAAPDGGASATQRAGGETAALSAVAPAAAPTVVRITGGPASLSPQPDSADTSPIAASPIAASPVTASPVTAAAASGTRRLVTFVNEMSQTIWVAAAPNPSTPLAATGWVLRPGHSVTISTPNNLNTRFWGRTGCAFNTHGVGHCQTGDCGGLFQCKGWGTIPATLAEVNFDAWDGLDFYDVSMVDGSNLPMYINVAGGSAAKSVSSDGCIPAGCTKPVQCPKALDVTAGGKVVGCISACARLGGDQYCCRGPYAPRADCNPAKWPVDYAAVFKRAEPYAYSYVDDDATSVYVCQGRCNYRIVFGLTPAKKGLAKKGLAAEAKGRHRAARASRIRPLCGWRQRGCGRRSWRLRGRGSCAPCLLIGTGRSRFPLWSSPRRRRAGRPLPVS
jgi:Thaumatin family